MRRRDLFLLAAPVGFAASPVRAGAPSKKAIYRGGTLDRIEPPQTGVVQTTGEETFVFDWGKGRLEAPYRGINSLEYGQKAGRRLGLAITVSPLFLLSKKRRHYLTIGYLDEQGGQQAIVLELGKKIVRSTLAGLEARTGLRVEYESEEARRAGRR